MYMALIELLWQKWKLWKTVQCHYKKSSRIMDNILIYTFLIKTTIKQKSVLIGGAQNLPY